LLWFIFLLVISHRNACLSCSVCHDFLRLLCRLTTSTETIGFRWLQYWS